jgi:nicotinamidase/pyrazinamidase
MIAEKWDISREDMEAYALRSHERAIAAIDEGRFVNEIAPVGDFATDEAPNFVETWPNHCVAGTDGADYHDALDENLIDVHIRKGQGKPAYSLFEGITTDNETADEVLDRLGVTSVDVAGIATDYCVLASALDALESGRRVRVLTDLVAGVAPESSLAALRRLEAAGVTLTTSQGE